MWELGSETWQFHEQVRDAHFSSGCSSFGATRVGSWSPDTCSFVWRTSTHALGSRIEPRDRSGIPRKWYSIFHLPSFTLCDGLLGIVITWLDDLDSLGSSRMRLVAAGSCLAIGSAMDFRRSGLVASFSLVLGNSAPLGEVP